MIFVKMIHKIYIISQNIENFVHKHIILNEYIHKLIL